MRVNRVGGSSAATLISRFAPYGTVIWLTAGTRGATCKVRYPEFIDHIVLDRRVAAQVVPGSFGEFTSGVPEGQHPSVRRPVSIALIQATAR